MGTPTKSLPLEGKVAAQPTDEVEACLHGSAVKFRLVRKQVDLMQGLPQPVPPRIRSDAPAPFAGASAAPEPPRQGVPPWTRYAMLVGFVKVGFSA